MCACAPSLKSVFGKFFHNIKSSKSNSKESSEAKSGKFDMATDDQMGRYFDSRITEDTTIDTDTTITDSDRSWYAKIPFGAKQKTDLQAGQELTSFSEADERGDLSSRSGAPGSADDEAPLRPAVFRHDLPHEDRTTTNPTSPLSKYTDMRSGKPAVRLPTSTAGYVQDGQGKGLPQPQGVSHQSSMPSFHNNSISHISDPSECGSSASSINDKVTEHHVKQQAQHSINDTPPPLAPPIVSPRGYPATKPANIFDSAAPALSPRGYQATRPTRGSSTSKPVMNLSFDATRP
jgi:hypothetical protein